MKKQIDIAKFLDGTPKGHLKVRVFVFLNQQYQERLPVDLEEAKQKVSVAFRDAQAEKMTEQWYNLYFEESD